MVADSLIPPEHHAWYKKMYEDGLSSAQEADENAELDVTDEMIGSKKSRNESF